MQIIYARYNRHRCPAFQTATLIVRESGSQYVLKQALTPEARAHLAQLRQAQRLLAQRRAAPQVSIPALLEDRCTPDSLALEYIDAPSLDQILWQAWRAGNKPAFLEALDGYRQLLAGAFGAQPRPVITPELRAIFGDDLADRLAERGPCSGVAFIDPVFENVLSRGTDRVFIDNEWVLPGALPVDFALYRALYYFVKVKYAQHRIEDFVSLEEILAHFKMTEADAAVYRALDERFQIHVFGEKRNSAYLDRYARYAHVSIASMEQTITHQRQVIRGLHGQLTAMINTPGWRMLEKLRRAAGRLAPAESRRRRLGMALWRKIWRMRNSAGPPA